MNSNSFKSLPQSTKPNKQECCDRCKFRDIKCKLDASGCTNCSRKGVICSLNSDNSEISNSSTSVNQPKPCDKCKEHRIRCDKNPSGCENCLKKGVDCTYLIERKRRGPKTKVEHFMRYYESLNNSNSNRASNKDQTPDILVTQEGECININSESASGLNTSLASSPNNNSPLQVSDDNNYYQMSPNMLTMYQSVYSPMLDASYYNLPLHLDFSSVAITNPLTNPIITTTAVTSMEYGMSPIYSPQNQMNLQSTTMFDEYGYPMYFN
ncbi:hypothetical protein CONCODRAFT_14161 [Conidiobolus coronatus NRRL 28638]|uniref:Zn(2)-C6 fungal-type domain-containing protein n=1 Tax=Conidiobolus coronatus (strain ATCC 28846 / CBS 209.66 / NRRL 28638) TaxID=796925 RepID=A0A137NPI9_CONC2|nr:hypothetical protein CONCODRAFT_14161 [Conidiobolus coronatus NRRL 28638]|eukprot:KXN64652.1 hypothetical protein CONCODRAFT_14161 [Conidiobolus coronatus NRRL 28638]